MSANTRHSAPHRARRRRPLRHKKVETTAPHLQAAHLPLSHTGAGVMRQVNTALTGGSAAQRQAAALDLQRTHGNRASARLLAGLASVQRAPSAGDQPLLRQGARGQAVSELQQLLVASGSAPDLNPDGIYGQATAAAVRAFQAGHGLTADGVVGQQTWSALQPGASAVKTPQGLGAGPAIRGPETPTEEAKAKYYHGLAFFRSGHYQAAVTLWRQVYAMPEMEIDIRAGMLVNLAGAYHKLGQKAEAVAMWQEYMLTPGADRDTALERIRQIRSGEDMKTSDQIKITPEQRKAADAQAEQEFEAANAASKAGDLEKALAHERLAYSLAAASPDVHTLATYRVGVAYKALGQFEQALDYLQETLGRPGLPEDKRLWALEQMRQARLGQKERVRPTTTMTEEQQKAKYYEGKAAYDRAEYAAALVSFKELYAEPKAEPKVRAAATLLVGVCHHRLGQFAQAISWYQEYLLFPDIRAVDQTQVQERIRQARMGESGLHLYQMEGKTGTVIGNEQIVFAAMIFFESGKSEVGPLGIETLRTLISLLNARRKGDPQRTFRIQLVGASSRRWQSAKEDEQAKQLNMRLSAERTASVQGMLSESLPDNDLKSGAFTIEPNAVGDEVGQTFGLDPSDNTWTQRNVALTVFSPVKK